MFMFVATNISHGSGNTAQVVAMGIFYVYSDLGAIPPSRVVMTAAASVRCWSEGKVAPFFICPQPNILFRNDQHGKEMFERERYIPFRRSKSLAKGSRSFAANETYTISIRNPEAHRSNIRPRDAYASGCDRPGYGKSRIF